MKLPFPWFKQPLAEPERPEKPTTKTGGEAFDGSGGETQARFSKDHLADQYPGNPENASLTQPPEPPEVSPDDGSWVAAFGDPTPSARAAGRITELISRTLLAPLPPDIGGHRPDLSSAALTPAAVGLPWARPGWTEAGRRPNCPEVGRTARAGTLGQRPTAPPRQALSRCQENELQGGAGGRSKCVAA